MDETQHVFPGGGVGQLFRVCQQEALAVYHFGRCSADPLYLEMRCCSHRVLCVFGEVPLQGLCHRPSHDGPLDQEISEEVLGGVMCVAVCQPILRVAAGFPPGTSPLVCPCPYGGGIS